MVTYAQYAGLDSDNVMAFIRIMRGVDLQIRENSRKRKDAEREAKREVERSSVKELRTMKGARHRG